MTRGGIAASALVLLLVGCNLPPTACGNDTLTFVSGSLATASAAGDDLQLGTVIVGQSVQQFFDLSESCRPVVVSDITLSGSPDFTLVLGADGGYIEPYEFQNVDAIVFRPSSVGPESATLTIKSNSVASPTIVVTLVGTGTTPGPPCGDDSQCASGSFCDGTYCEANACQAFDNLPAGDAGIACAPESSACPGANGLVLTDTRSDPHNCGGCGKACPSGHGCGGGQCGVCAGYRIGPEKDFFPQFQGTGTQASGFVLGDFDGDGHPDVLLGGSSALLLSNDGKGGFGGAGQAINTCGASPFLAADFNGDCSLDVLAGNVVMINDGHGQFLARNNVLQPQASSFSDAVADLNQDGYPDIVEASAVIYGTPQETAELLLGDGRGGFREYFLSANNLNSLVVGDFNGDGRPDVEGYESAGSGTFVCYLSDGGADLSVAADYFSLGNQPVTAGLLATGPLTGGVDDVIYGSGNTILAFPDPAVGTNGGVVLPLDAGPIAQVLTSADLDLDGRSDVLAAGASGDGGFLDLWTGFSLDGGQLSAGGFQTQPTTSAAAIVQVADVNGDGIPDIVAVGGTGAPVVMVFLGTCP